MKKLLALIFLSSFTVSVSAQKGPVGDVTRTVVTRDAEAHLTFLAADEMRGRKTGSPEIDIAANYIASFFKQQGLKTLPGAEQYFQLIELESMKAPKDIQLVIEGQAFKMREDVVLMAGDSAQIQGEIVFAGYGSREDMEKAGVKDKIVVTFAGNANENNIAKAFLYDAGQKSQMAQELGAKALVEVLALPGIPWPNIANRLSEQRTSLKKNVVIPHLWMRNSENAALTALKETRRASGSLVVRGTNKKQIRSRNVISLVEGTDAKLKNEFIVISAHYDHVGVNPAAKPDSIFNGARDNAIGTVAMMQSAKYLAMFPPKRSVIFMALTGEEEGMLGSSWYVDHPLVPLNKTVFNFNCDGAGYNDTTIATVIGLERTSVQGDLTQACSKFGLKAEPDPVPEQNLYERSDNYSFAAKGIPAIDFAPGTKSFDAELMKYYHRPADEVAGLDFNYLIRFFRAFVYANHLLANNPKRPFWTPGDKFETEGKKLYGK